MLERLVQYAQQHGLPGPGFAPKQVRWAIQCNQRGQYLGVVELGDPSSRKTPGREFPLCPDLSQPELVGGTQARSHFLIETAHTVVLYGKPPTDAKKAKKRQQKHRFFIQLLKNAATACHETAWFVDLLESESLRQQINDDLQRQKARPTDKITLMVVGRNPPFLVEDTCWHQWWREFRASLGAPEGPPGKGKHAAMHRPAARMRCLVTGELVEPAKTHPKITKLTDVGAPKMGAALVCFDKDAFCSYGLKQSANAAMSEEAAAAYRAALDDILAKHSACLAGAKIAHWFDRHVPPQHDPLSFLWDPSKEHQEQEALDAARQLLTSIQQGKRPEETALANNRYHILTVSGNASRVMVRAWVEGRFEELLRNTITWFDDLAIVRPDGTGLAKPPKFKEVLGSLFRDLKDIPAPLAAVMWNVAVQNRPIPSPALARAVERATIDVLKDNPPNHARMGLMKAYLLRKGETRMQPELNPQFDDPAYQCGRLMAVLADLQRAALGDVGAGVVQRYYAAACATPALVLGRLIRTSQFHLDRLQADKPGLAHWFDQRIAEICASIKQPPPRTLTLEEQTLFALGYYQQKAARPQKETLAAAETEASP
ncbi:MAG: type I-C CRISPR-associated protein Cas8c/Csd1 [Bryobacteraceae bacterium]